MKVISAWSSGKDAAWATHLARRDRQLEVEGLLSLMSSHERVFMHATRPEVVAAQASALGLKLYQAQLPPGASDDQYEAVMLAELNHVKANGVSGIVFGDLFLEDVMRHHDELAARAGLKAFFPLRGADTRQLAGEMLTAGVEAYLTCVDLQKLDASFAGRRWDALLLQQLPKDIDPCGEFGEFHTLVVNGPMFRTRVDCRMGDVVQREGFAFADAELRDPGFLSSRGP